MTEEGPATPSLEQHPTEDAAALIERLIEKKTVVLAETGNFCLNPLVFLSLSPNRSCVFWRFADEGGRYWSKVSEVTIHDVLPDHVPNGPQMPSPVISITRDNGARDESPVS